MTNKDDYEIIINKNNTYIRNYKQIISISSCNILIKMLKVIICIKGNDLIISKMDKYDLLIKGIVKEIEIKDE